MEAFSYRPAGIRGNLYRGVCYRYSASLVELGVSFAGRFIFRTVLSFCSESRVHLGQSTPLVQRFSNALLERGSRCRLPETRAKVQSYICRRKKIILILKQKFSKLICSYYYINKFVILFYANLSTIL